MSEQSDFDKRNALWGEYGDAYLDRGDESDPEYWSDERRANRDRWRAGAQQLQDRVAEAEVQGAENGQDADSVLKSLGFADQKDHGKYIWGQFNNKGLYATEGAAVDPNLTYDWATGRATWKPGTDNAGQSRPINANEKAEHAKAQEYQARGLQGYGQQQAATNFKKAQGHWQYDAKTGLWVNPGTASAGDYANWDFRDNLGRKVSAPAGYQAKTDDSQNSQGAQRFQEEPPMPFMSTPGQQEKKTTQQNTHQPAQYNMFPNSQGFAASSTPPSWSMSNMGKEAPQAQTFGALQTMQPTVSSPQGKAAPQVYSPSVLGKPNAFAQTNNFNNQQAWTDDPLDPAYKKSGVNWLGNGSSQTWGAGYNPSSETPNTPSTPVPAQTGSTQARNPWSKASMFNL